MPARERLRVQRLQPEPQRTSRTWTIMQCPLPRQIVGGRQRQVGIPAQAAGTAAQNGGGGVHGGGTHPGPAAGEHLSRKVHPGGHAPRLARGTQTGRPPPQPGLTRTSEALQEMAARLLPSPVPAAPPVPEPSRPPEELDWPPALPPMPFPNEPRAPPVRTPPAAFELPHAWQESNTTAAQKPAQDRIALRLNFSIVPSPAARRETLAPPSRARA